MKTSLWLRPSQRALLHHGSEPVVLQLWQQDYGKDVLVPVYNAKHNSLFDFNGYCLRVVRSKPALEQGYSKIVWLGEDDVLTFRAVHVFNISEHSATDIERNLVDDTNIRRLDIEGLRWLQLHIAKECYRDMRRDFETPKKVAHLYSRTMAVLYPITVRPNNRIWRR